MKTTAIIFTLFLFIKPVIPLIEYVAFYDYIVNELCENRDTPELQCNGKCHLKKELAKASDSESNNEKKHSTTAEHNIVFFEKNTTECALFPKIKQHLKLNLEYINIYKFDYTTFVFHPPLA
ncbi:hypothetical protein ACW5R3_06255 [Bizionia sp. KMM 8389]